MRVALIGCGDIGWMRAAAIAETPGFKLIVASDIDAKRGQPLAEKYSAAFETDWRAALHDDVDLVLVSTPPPFHAEMCVAAFEKGKHVLCEKPLARNPQECRLIFDAAKKAGKHLATGFNYRFYAAVVKAREILDSGRIGELDHIRSYAGHPGGSEFTHPWVHDVKVMGGGALVDNGIHILDLTRYFLGEVAEVKGFRTHHVWKFDGCEDNAFALLRNANGRIAQVQASWSEWRGYRWWIEVYGTRGMVRAAYPPMFAQATFVDEKGSHPRRESYLFPAFQLKEKVRSYRWTVVQSFVQEFAAFAKAASGEKTPAATGFDGMRAVEIAHAVYSGSEAGKSVTF